MPDTVPLIVFADDWGRHPSSAQHLVRHLLPRRRVTWVNTIGTRPPRFDRATLRRGMEKLRQWFLPGAGSRPEPTCDRPSVPSQPVVLNPKMWPSFRSWFGRRLNRWLLTRALEPVCTAGPPPVLLTTLPLVADLVGRLRAARWVYYCVDDFSAWPGLDGRTLRELERELVSKVDVVIAVSETLRQHIARLGRSAHLLTHGVDLDFWQAPAPAGLPPSLAPLAGFEPPLIVYWGVIDRRMDTAFVRELDRSLARGTILLVGPQDDPDPALLRLRRVRTLPPVPYTDLPALAARSAVLIAPYADLPVTRAMQPLKLKEYLATGRPVVVRRLPATEPWADCADVIATAPDFAAAVRERLAGDVPPAQRQARQRLEAESWAAKAELLERWIEDSPGPDPHSHDPVDLTVTNTRPDGQKPVTHKNL